LIGSESVDTGSKLCGPFPGVENWADVKRIPASQKGIRRALASTISPLGGQYAGFEGVTVSQRCGVRLRRSGGLIRFASGHFGKCCVKALPTRSRAQARRPRRETPAALPRPPEASRRPSRHSPLQLMTTTAKLCPLLPANRAPSRGHDSDRYRSSESTLRYSALRAPKPMTGMPGLFIRSSSRQRRSLTRAEHTRVEGHLSLVFGERRRTGRRSPIGSSRTLIFCSCRPQQPPSRVSARQARIRKGSRLRTQSSPTTMDYLRTAFQAASIGAVSRSAWRWLTKTLGILLRSAPRCRLHGPFHGCEAAAAKEPLWSPP
jgi:hypothetical protein